MPPAPFAEASARDARALVQTLSQRELEHAGEVRRRALALAEAQLERVARQLATALRAGLSIAEIARVTNISRPTLYALRERYGPSSGNLQCDILCAVAVDGPLTVAALLQSLTAPQEEIRKEVRDLQERRLLETALARDSRVGYLVVTHEGQGLLADYITKGLGTPAAPLARPNSRSPSGGVTQKPRPGHRGSAIERGRR